MDTKLKGKISDALDEIVEQKDLVERASWAVNAIKSIYVSKSEDISYEDIDKLLTLAYVLGGTMTAATNTIFNDRLTRKTLNKIFDQITKILGEDQSIKFHTKLARNRSWLRGLDVEVSEEEFDYNRERIAPLVPIFITKINQEYALEKSRVGEK